MHSPIHGRNRTEVDIIGVRFPLNAEPIRGVGTDEQFDASNEVVDCVIGEVKSRGEQLRFNEALRSSREAVESVLYWCGYFTAAERPVLADAVLKILEPQTGGQNAPTATGPRASRVRAVLFSRERHARRHNQAWFVTGPTIFAHIWRCLRPAEPTDASPAMLELARMHARNVEDLRLLVLPDDPIPSRESWAPTF